MLPVRTAHFSGLVSTQTNSPRHKLWWITKPIHSRRTM
jgi:hypothetical protein